ncbi:hypothetical protein ACTWJ8_02930 [Streptomyces sp. SDT5-1]|uniref:hypothetical protein n=1 Tax=Streptomyces sp. SDT5-1 TaxID=3406418 RepID=UPI003FD06B51
MNGTNASRRALCSGTSAALLLLVVAGCTDSGDHGGASGSSGRSSAWTPSAASSNGPPPADIARRRATAAYLGMWQDVAAAARTSDWKSPLLARHATGDALGTITRGMYADHRNGLVTRGAPRNDPTVSRLTPRAAPVVALVSDCGDSTHWLKYRKTTGKLADSTPGGRRAITAEVKKQDDGAWKVTRFAVERVGSC